jgi:hypothetical protein
MADSDALSDHQALSVVAAAVAFLGTDAAFGPTDERTLLAKGKLQLAVHSIVQEDEDEVPTQPQLDVLDGGARS